MKNQNKKLRLVLLFVMFVIIIASVSVVQIFAADSPRVSGSAGDINNDGLLNNKDVARYIQYLAGWDVYVDEFALDTNGDGAVNNKDVTRLMQYFAGWDVEIYYTNEETDTTTPVLTAPTQTTATGTENVGPDVDPEMKEIVFVVSDPGDGLNVRSILADDTSGNYVDVAIAKRNQKAMDELNCKISVISAGQSISEKLGESLLAGSKEYDIIVARQNKDVQLANKGALKELSGLKEVIRYDMSHWASEYIDTINYSDSVYWLTGDLSLRYMGGASGVFVNKELYANFVEPMCGDINYLVYSETWTWEVLREICQNAYSDKNGNGVVDAEDNIGFASMFAEWINPMMISAEIPFGEEKNGIIEIGHLEDHKVYDVYERFSDLKNNSFGVLDVQRSQAIEMFKNGNLLMMFGNIYYAELYLQDMDQNFAFVPMPKYSENQITYSTAMSDDISLYGINKHSEKIEEAAALLDYLAYLSHNNVRSAYYEKAIKGSVDSSEMIDFVSDTVTVDIVYASKYTDYFSSLGLLFRRYLDRPSEIVTQIRSQSMLWHHQAMEFVSDYVHASQG